MASMIREEGIETRLGVPKGNALYEIQNGKTIANCSSAQPDGSQIVEYLIQRKSPPEFAYIRQTKNGPLVQWDKPIYGSADELKRKFPYMFSNLMEGQRGE